MKHTHWYRGVILAGVMVLGIGGRASGAEMGGASAADSSLSIARFYTSSVVGVGAFPGTLVQLSCDTDGVAPQAQLGEGYALVLRDDDAVHRLVPGTDEVRNQLGSAGLHGADAEVHGKYYPSTGAIFASRIVVHTPAAQARASSDPPRGWWSGERLDTGYERPLLARCVSR